MGAKNKRRLIRVVVAALFALLWSPVFAQGDPTDSLPDDPGALSVTKIQDLNFGAFSTTGSGGTITVSAGGLRSATGSVIPMNLGYAYFQAIFDLMAADGSIITILNGPDAILTGSNGGTVSLRLGASSPSSPFVNTAVPPDKKRIYIGGTLTIGNASASPPGRYTGTFDVTFNYQ